MSRTTKALIVLLSALSLSGCAWWDALFKDKACPTIAEFAVMPVPNQEPLQLESPIWYVITPKNAQERFTELEKAGKDSVFFGLTDEGYETLSIGVEKTQGYIILQRETIDALDAYYRDVQARMKTPADQLK